MLSAQLLSVAFDLAYDLSSQYLQFTLIGPLNYNNYAALPDSLLRQGVARMLK